MNTTFKASPFVRVAFVLVLIAAPLMSWVFRHEDGALWLHLLDAVGVVAVFLAWPRTIHFDGDGIWQRDLFGGKKRIPWGQVGSLAFLRADDKAIVGGGSVQIVHNLLHRDKAKFCELISQRTNTQVASGL